MYEKSLSPLTEKKGYRIQVVLLTGSHKRDAAGRIMLYFGHLFENIIFDVIIR